MLQLQLIGNLTQDASLKEIKGKSYNTFSVAVNTSKESVTYVSVCHATDPLTNPLGAWLTKGRRVFVQGRLSASAYINRDGNAMPDLTVWADTIELLGGNNQNTL